MSALLSSAFSSLFSGFNASTPVPVAVPTLITPVEAPVFLPDTTTSNGALAYSTSLSSNVDFFGSICRSDKKLTIQVEDKIDQLLPLMWAEDPLICLRNILFKRDAREGPGEKAIFLRCYSWLFKYHPETAYKNLIHIPFYGYWKDLLNLLSTEDSGYDRSTVRNKTIAKLFSDQIKLDLLAITANTECSLAGKWAPSLDCSYDKKFKICRLIAQELGYGKAWQKTYRQMLSGMRAHLNVVEKAMCSRLWESIKLDHVPSVAMNRYKKAFKAHLPTEYEAWINRVKTGESKVNAKMLLPHELVSDSQLNNGLTQLQWNSLRESVREKGKFAGIIPICDFSGSMQGLPMDVSMALGIMISELSEEPFKDLMISFSENPTFFKFQGDNLATKVRHARSSGVSQGLNTDIIRCFTILLQRCQENKLTQTQIPSKIILLTDCAFDSQTRNSDLTSFQTIRKMYTEAGYKAPILVFWNIWLVS